MKRITLLCIDGKTRNFVLPFESLKEERGPFCCECGMTFKIHDTKEKLKKHICTTTLSKNSNSISIIGEEKQNTIEQESKTMEIFTIERENGEYEDKAREIIYVGTNKNYALQHKQRGNNTLYMSTWLNGKLVSEYYKDLETRGWERNL